MFSYFRHQTIRRYIALFGSYFDDITVQRYDRNGNHIQTLGVPIAYGPKQKWLVRLDADANLDRDIAVQVPRMGFELTSISYDPERKLNTTQKNFYVSSSDNTVNKTQYVPIPYNIDIILSIYVKNAEDGTQIVEQILPYFRPEWNNSVNLIPEMNIAMDVPTILNSVDIEDTYESDFLNRRALIWNMNFTMKGYLFGPVSTSGVITRTQIDFHANTDISNSARVARVVTVPGLLANGSTTTNSSASISRNLIKSTDDYGFASNTFFYNDGLKYNPVTGRDEK